MRDLLLRIGRLGRRTGILLLLVGILPMNVAAQDEPTQRIVVRAARPDTRVSGDSVEIKFAGERFRASAVLEPGTTPVNIAFVIDAGPNQRRVLDREKYLAVSILDAISVPVRNFLVVRAGYRSTISPAGSEKGEARRLIEALETEKGRNSGIPIYDAVHLATGELAKLAGMRVVVVIAEGNDYRSSIGYKGLRDLAETRAVMCLVALVDDHPTRGTKSILRYGWSLRALADDTAGDFIENSKNVERTATRFRDLIASLRMVVFEIGELSPGRYRVSVSSTKGARLRSQKDLVIGKAASGSLN